MNPNNESDQVLRRVKEHFLPLEYKSRNLTFEQVYNFEIEMPYQVAVPEDRIFSYLGYSEEEDLILRACSVMFSHKKHVQTVYGIKTEAVRSLAHVMCSVAIASFEEEKPEDIATRTFDAALSNLNDVLRAYRLTANDLSIHLLHRLNIPPICLYFTVDYPSAQEANVATLMVNTNFSAPKQLITEAGILDEMNRMDGIIRSSSNPFILPKELMFEASRNIAVGKNKGAVINANTSVETFLRSALQIMWASEGLSEDEMTKREESSPFLPLIRREYQSRISGVNWDTNDMKSTFGKWHANCYKVRNRVVHGGYAPDSNEAGLALSSAEEFMRALTKKFMKNTTKYPEFGVYLIS